MARRDVRAWCHECDKYWDSKNAQGVAQQHANKTGHEVIVEIITAYIAKPKTK